jgi:hypothetical protein
MGETMDSHKEPKIFLVRMGVYFFTGFDKNRKPMGVTTPSTAQHLTYRKADEIVQHLLKLKYEGVCVTDVTGKYADLETIQAAEEAR